MTKTQIKKFLEENPEYETVEEFIQFLQDDERTSFSKSDIYHLQDATGKGLILGALSKTKKELIELLTPYVGEL